ncbi:MAG TPA: ABC transporter substrate-binding protein [Candidatus Lustribacter sp.]
MQVFLRRAIAVSSALLMLVLPLALAAPARAATSLTVGITGRGSNDWPLFIAQRTGIFAANGLDVSTVDAGSPVGAAQQLIGGSLQIGAVTSTEMIEAIQGGATIVSLRQNVNKPPYLLVGKKGVTSVQQLRGKTVIVSGPSAITRVFADAMLAGHGVKQDEVQFTYAGATNARFAALLSGGVDAAILLPPFSFRAIAQGYPVLDDVQKYYPHFPFDTYAASKTWLPTHRTEAVAFLKSILSGVRWLYDPANKSRALQILSEETNTSADDAQKTYDLLVTKLHAFSMAGTSVPGDYQLVIDALVKLSIVKPPLPAPTKFYDNTYANEALAQLDKRK